LIGRIGERAELSVLLEQTRSVKIAGAGGAGKTRLADAVVTDLVGLFNDVVWVELARVSAEADGAGAVARACGALEAPGVELVEVFSGFLGAKNVLIVLDDCEHLLGPAPPWSSRSCGEPARTDGECRRVGQPVIPRPCRP
jgi:predicted ATPase